MAERTISDDLEFLISQAVDPKKADYAGGLRGQGYGSHGIAHISGRHVLPAVPILLLASAPACSPTSCLPPLTCVQ